MSDNSAKRKDSSVDNSKQTSQNTGFEFNMDSDETLEEPDDISLDRVSEVVTEEFDEQMWGVTEALLSAHATLLIESVGNCTGLILVGESGAGKTTAIRFLEGLDGQVYRSDEMTPASFVSHDASQSDEDLEDVDLLPRIKHQSLTCRDMATWFSGEWETIYTRMARMAHLMDGEGLTRDSGAHGQRGYEGDDFRFTVIGATTPLSPRAWEVMGHTGQRFVFYEKRSEDADLDAVKESIFGDNSYSERVQECREIVHKFLRGLWFEHSGYKNVPDLQVTDEAQDALMFLGNVVKHSRATLTKNDQEAYVVSSQEGLHRVVALLRDITKGRALLDGRMTVEVEDVQVSARIALSTMPKKRRPLVRLLLDPTEGPVKAEDVEDVLDVSRPTATDRMDQMIALDIGEWVETDDGRGTLVMKPRSEFEWPDCLDFPEFGGA